MPCMGPTMPDDKEIDQVTEEVLDFLRQKHRVHRMEGRLQRLVEPSRQTEKESLREAVKQLLRGRNCEEF